MNHLLTRHHLRTALAAVFVLTAAIAAASWFGGVTHPKPVHADRRDFWFLNDTSKQIDHIYVSGHSHESWENDVLGDSAVLADKIGFLITFSGDYQSGCMMDFKIIYHDGSSDTYREGMNTCDLHAVIFTDGEAHGY
ncbi:MAG: hypothetical protein WCC14_10305 [Acidobacteriaceae bacterium]